MLRIRIRTKLMLFFMVLVLFFSAMTVFLHSNNRAIVKQYDEVLQRFFLLNEIYRTTSKVNESMNNYFLNLTEESYQQYLQQFDRLRKYQQRLVPGIESERNYLIIKNYNHMIEQFLEECTTSIEKYAKQDINEYYTHLAQAGKLSGFIQDMTLPLINSELTDYQYYYSMMRKQNMYFQWLSISLLFSTVIICAMFVYTFSSGITRPIHRLSQVARQISRGNFEGEDVKAESRDELHFLTETFNKMRSNFRELVKEIKQKSELDNLVKKMELKSLQSQINPHFLFNTLSMVAKMAYVEGAERTSELAESISTLLRYNLNKLNQPVVLRDEVEIIKEYFFIQQMRFGKRVTIETNIDSSCLDIPIPPLTLQPIVENAFIHGIEDYECGARLELIIYRKGDSVILEVKDNGKGMNEETKERLLRSEDPASVRGADDALGGETTGGIGMRNVRRRLQLFFHTEHVLEIDSNQGTGTTIRLILPRHEIAQREDINVQAANC